MNTKSSAWDGEYYKKHTSMQKHEWVLGPIENINFNGDETILDIVCCTTKQKGTVITTLFSEMVNLAFYESIISHKYSTDNLLIFQ